MSMVNSISSVRFVVIQQVQMHYQDPADFPAVMPNKLQQQITAPADKPKKSGGKKF